MPPLCLLGPQRLQPTLDQVLTLLGIDGPLAVITAGWEDRESEDQELLDHLHRPAVGLRLFGRTEEIFAVDPDLLAGFRRRRDRFATEQDLYRVRLAHALDACRSLMERNGPGHEEAASHLEAALAGIWLLDSEHRERLARIQADFEAEMRLASRSSLVRHRRQVAGELDRCQALVIAGGHVVALLNRLRLFGVARLAEAKPIIAWSAGAMVLGERIVAFHDSPPQGPGNAEVVENGLGRFAGLLPLPHARRRLRLEDRSRVELLSRRFDDSHCLPLDEGDWLIRSAGAWTASGAIRRLELDGSVQRVALEALGRKR